MRQFRTSVEAVLWAVDMGLAKQQYAAFSCLVQGRPMTLEHDRWWEEIPQTVARQYWFA